jgi:hypothetical protein
MKRKKGRERRKKGRQSVKKKKDILFVLYYI